MNLQIKKVKKEGKIFLFDLVSTFSTPSYKVAYSPSLKFERALKKHGGPGERCRIQKKFEAVKLENVNSKRYLLGSRIYSLIHL